MTETAITIEPTPLSLLQQAINNNVDPDKLDKLLSLAERHNANKALLAFNASMNEAQAEMPTVVRDAVNQHTKSRYARLEAVAKAIKPVYVQHGFNLIFSEGTSPLEGHRRFICKVSHNDGHSESVQLDSPVDDGGIKGNANKNAIQALGSAVSYAKRYLTCMAFNVTIADEDDDGNGPDAQLNDEQEAFLESLFVKCSEAGNPANRQKFLEMFSAPSLREIKQAKYQSAREALEMKLRKSDKS